MKHKAGRKPLPESEIQTVYNVRMTRENRNKWQAISNEMDHASLNMTITVLIKAAYQEVFFGDDDDEK